MERETGIEPATGSHPHAPHPNQKNAPKIKTSLQAAAKSVQDAQELLTMATHQLPVAARPCRPFR